jgi:hypothetical protein
MSLVLLALLALRVPSSGTSPQDLVAQLQSPRAIDRDEADDALEALGLRALPALRAAGASINDPEVQGRIADLIDRIGNRPLLRPTLVKIDVHDRPLEKVVSSLRARRGLPIVLEPGDDRLLRERPVTLDTAGPVGFWEALDRLGVAGGVRLDPTPARGSASSSPRIRLVAGDWPPAPTAYAGPYRLVLMSLNHHRQVRQVRPPAEAEVVEEFSAAFQLVAEPGIFLGRNGPIRLIEAIDDRGRDLRASSPLIPPDRSVSLRRWNEDGLKLLTYRVPLTWPADRGRRLARLRGYAPVTAVTRTDLRVSFPLEGAEGRSFSGGGLTIAVRKVERKAGPDGPPRINALDLAVRGGPTDETSPYATGPNQLSLATIRLKYHADDHIQVEDANGRVYPLYSNALPAGQGRMHEFRVNLISTPTLGPPARLRYYGVAAVATEVPFDFADLPLP